VAQQVLDGDRPVDRLKPECELAGWVELFDADLHIGKGGNVF